MPLPLFAALPALKAFASTWWRALIGFLIAAPIFFLLGQCDGKKIERKAWEAKAAKMALAAEKLQRSADELRRAAETADRTRITTERQEIDDAVKDIPDQPLTARQRARVCVELRRQNAPAEQLAAACGPARTP